MPDAKSVVPGDNCPSDEVLACLSTPGHSCLLDSGTSHNLVCDRAHFHSYFVDDSVRVHTANHGHLLTSGSRECVGLLTVSGDKRRVKFSGCLHTPGAMLNLLSVGWMLTKGWECHFWGDPSHCDISYHGSTLGSVPLQNNLCFLDLEFLRFDAPLPVLKTPTPLSAFARVAITHDLWHANLGHVDGEAARHASHFADGVEVTSTTPLSFCESCIVGKHPHKPFFPSECGQSMGFLDLVHADVAGPMPVQTPHGCCYFLVILDNFMHILDLHLLTTKDQALNAWESTWCCWEMKFSQRVKEFQSDNGGEFLSSAFTAALDVAGITHHLSVPYMHQQNSTVEHVIHTIEGHLLAMLHHAGLPQTYWGEVALTAAYLHNRTESCTLPPGRTPYEMLHGQRPNLSHLHVWGCRGFSHIPLEQQAKLGPKSREILFMGYPPGVKGYQVCDVIMGQFFNSRDVIFDENLALPHLTGEAPVPPVNVVDDDDVIVIVCVPAPSVALSPTTSADIASSSVDAASLPAPALSSSAPITSDPLRCSACSWVLTEAGCAFQEGLEHTKARLARWSALPSLDTSPLSNTSPSTAPDSSPLSPLTLILESPPPGSPGLATDDVLPDAVMNLVILEHVHLAIWSDTCRDPGAPSYDMGLPPATYDKAMHRSDADCWHAAMEKEMTLLHDMKVYDLVQLPPGAHAIGSRWVLEYKSGDGKGGPIEKACFIAKGFTQVSGRDFGRTFAPVARRSSIRVIAAHCAKEDWELHSLNIKHAFLHGKVEEDMYIKQPQGYETFGPNGKTLVSKLNSSLYGIKQAAYEFYRILCEELEAQGFVCCEADHTVFYFHRNDICCLLA